MNTNPQNIKADLHSHTFYSDGKFSPSELVKKAKNLGLKYLAITDHDNVDAIEEASNTGKEIGLEIIPGVELSAEHNGREVHILGYFIDNKNEELREFLSRFRKQRTDRAKAMVEKLNESGINLSLESVFKNYGENISIGRPHIAQALIEGKFVQNYYEAFSKYIGEGKVAYVKKPNISANEAAKLIARSGGLSFIAHPGKNIRDLFLIELIEAGIDGIEVVHPSHSPEDIVYFQDFVSQYFLLESGGSDFHGGKDNDADIFGLYYIAENKVQAMKNRLFYG